MKQKQQQRISQWRQIVAEQETSEQSIREFCRQRGINEHSFYTWRVRVREQPVSFALVDTRSEAIVSRSGNPVAASQRIEILLAGGERIQLPAEASILHLVLRTLGELAR